jgi:hypothetical protein
MAAYLGSHGFRTVDAEDGAAMRAAIERSRPTSCCSTACLARMG